VWTIHRRPGLLPAASAPLPPDYPPVRRREILGWASYDFASSSYTTVIVTVVFSVYFVEVVHQGQPGGYALWSAILAASQLLVVLLSPVLGALGDVTARKKVFLGALALVCALATAGLGFTGPGTVLLAVVLLFIANVAFSLGDNFCASFLPEISTHDNVGRISAYGWAFGYCGGLLSLIGALVLIRGLPEDGVRASFFMAGLFFVLAVLPTLLLLRERARPLPLAASAAIAASFGRLRQTWGELRQHRALAIFLLAFFFYIAGLSAVFAFAAIVASSRYGFSQIEIIAVFAALQISAALGALAFGWWQDRVGARPVLLASLLGWILVSLAVAFFESKPAFWVIACAAGLVMGSTQSASRAVVSLLTPQGRSGEFFGFWGLAGKLAAVVGPLVFGLVAELLSLPMAALANALFFVLGLVILLAFVPWPASTTTGRRSAAVAGSDP